MAAVPENYAHYAKYCQPAAPLTRDRATLKWYDIFREDEPIDAAIAAIARDYVRTSVLPGLGEPDDLGFVILHRCGAAFHFLLVQIWRGANEIWEAVYYTDAGQEGFAPFPAANPGPPQVIRPTFCVWEMGAVAFEARAWADYLSSPRGGDDRARYLESGFEGIV